MLPLNDPKWASLQGGYRSPYDASKALFQLECGEDVWDELWGNLLHQGDVGDSSYAAVLHLARIAQGRNERTWQFYSMAATIEIERHRKSNPPIPDWMIEDYEQSLKDLCLQGITDLQTATDPLLVRSILGLVALSKGMLKLGALVSFTDDSEIAEILENQQAWSDLYA